jgi:hypothetical protein
VPHRRPDDAIILKEPQVVSMDLEATGALNQRVIIQFALTGPLAHAMQTSETPNDQTGRLARCSQ